MMIEMMISPNSVRTSCTVRTCNNKNPLCNPEEEGGNNNNFIY